LVLWASKQVSRRLVLPQKDPHSKLEQMLVQGNVNKECQL
jgi:hypothetical protein